jgi:hypothetical protein
MRKSTRTDILYFSFILGLIILITISCNNTATTNTGASTTVSNSGLPSQKTTLIKLLLGNGNNLFRTVNLGADFKSVLASEKKLPDENDTDDISFTLPIDTLRPDSVNEPFDSVNYYKITYYFYKNKLNEIDEDIFLENDSAAATLFNRFTDYFTDKYGDYASQNDSRVWRISKKGAKEWVSLSDQSEEYDGGKLTIVLYGEEY